MAWRGMPWQRHYHTQESILDSARGVCLDWNNIERKNTHEGVHPGEHEGMDICGGIRRSIRESIQLSISGGPFENPFFLPCFLPSPGSIRECIQVSTRQCPCGGACGSHQGVHSRSSRGCI